MKNRIITNSFRTIKKSFSRFIPLFVMSFLGVLVFAGLQSVKPDMMTTLDNFLEAHKKDFDIIRSNMVTIYANISEINRDYMVKTERLLSMMENNRITKEEIYKAVKMVRKDICMDTDDLLTRFNSFIFSEEKAHSDNTKISDILDDIDEKYKNNEIYQEVNKD